MSAVLSNSYFAVLITLHRNLLPSNPNIPRPKPIASSQSLAHCVDAARSVIHVAAQSKVLVPVSHHLAVFCQYLWSSAVILLLCETRAKEQLVVEAVGAHVESCRTSLRALEPVWPGASKLRELLSEVETRAKEVRAVAAAPRTKKRKSPSTDRSTNGRSKAAAGTTTSPVKEAASLSGPTWTGQISGSGPSSGAGTGPFPTPPIPNTIAPSSLGMGTGAGTFDIFDVGGMTFDGLEMLNAFTSDAWQAPLVGPPSAGAGNTNTNSPLDLANVTPTGDVKPLRSPATRMGSGAGLDTTPTLQASPHTATAGAAQGQGQGQGQQGPGQGAQWLMGQSPGPGPAELAEIWSQIAGTTFDWQADPSVPFSI